MDDEIIDLSDYLSGREESSTFAVHGGEGERSRLALPVWRAVYLMGGDRGAIAWAPASGGALRPFFVLDLGGDPARTELADGLVAGLAGREPPALEVASEAVAVLLARDERRRWFLLVVGRGPDGREPGSAEREDLLFLAGECAGLLLHRDLAGEL